MLFLESSHKWVCGAEILQRTRARSRCTPRAAACRQGGLGPFLQVVAIHPRVDRRALAVHLDSCQQEMEDLCDAFKALDFTRGLFRLRQFLQGTTLDSATMTSKLASMSAAKTSLDQRLEALAETFCMLF